MQYIHYDIIILYYTIISVYEGARGLCTLENGLYYSTVPIERGGTAYYIGTYNIIQLFIYFVYILFIILTGVWLLLRRRR